MRQGNDQEMEKWLRDVAPGPEVRSEVAEALLERVLAEFDQASRDSEVKEHVSSRSLWKRGVEIMRKPIPRLMAAVIVLVVCGLTLFSPGTQESRTFAGLLEQLANAKTAKFKIKVKQMGMPEQEGTAYFREPSLIRHETPVSVTISDFQAGKTLSLVRDGKQATLTKLTNRPEATSAEMNFFGNIQELLKKAKTHPEVEVEELPEEEIDGKKVFGFRLSEGIFTQTVWGDAKTNMPVKLKTKFAGPVEQYVEMSEFELNVRLDDKLFDMTVPEGWSVQELEVDASPATEEDFLKAMKEVAETNDGEFPPGFVSISSSGVFGKVVATKVVTTGRGQTREVTPESSKKMFAIGRGFSFAMLMPAKADAHYAGKGVKLNAKETPILWYRPEGQKLYRVVYADLSVKESEKAPEVKGAVPLSRVGKKSAEAKK